MYAEVKLQADLGRRVVVPEEAVIAGELRVVFEDLGRSRLPRKVQTGQRAGGFIEIIKGIEAGDKIVTSGSFLIALKADSKRGWNNGKRRE